MMQSSNTTMPGFQLKLKSRADFLKSAAIFGRLARETDDPAKRARLLLAEQRMRGVAKVKAPRLVKK